MKSIKYYTAFLTKLLARYHKRIFIAALIFAALVWGIYQYRKNTSREILTEGIVGTFTEKELPLLITNLISQPLVTIDDTFKPKPVLVKPWTSNDESTIYDFTLKDEIYWSDGSKIKSTDLEFPIPDLETSFPDERTLHFKLADSYSPFPSLLMKPIFKKNTLTGTGQYRIEKIQKDVVFLRKILLKPVDKKLPDIQFKFYPNEKIAKNALKIGEVQVLVGINEIEDISTKPPFAILKKPSYTKLVTIFYNTQDPVLDDNLRLTLSYGAPSINSEERAKTSIPVSSWAFNPQVKDFLDNPESAKASLEKTKIKADSTIILTATNSLKTVGEKVVSAWNKLGIKAVLRVESGIPQNFQALLISQKIPLDPDQYSLWHKLGQTNISKFSNPRIDKDLEDGRKLKDLESRKLKYQDFQKALLDRAPATFLYFQKINVIYLKKVEGNLNKIIDLQLKNI